MFISNKSSIILIVLFPIWKKNISSLFYLSKCFKALRDTNKVDNEKWTDFLYPYVIRNLK